MQNNKNKYIRAKITIAGWCHNFVTIIAQIDNSWTEKDVIFFRPQFYSSFSLQIFLNSNIFIEIHKVS